MSPIKKYYFHTNVRRKEDGNNIFFLLRFWKAIKEIFIKEEIEEPVEQLLEKPKIDERAEEIKLSLSKIDKVESFYKKTNLPVLKDIYDLTKIIHDVFVENNIKHQKLNQFHTYYTDNYIPLVEKIIKSQDEKADFLKKRELNIQHKIDTINKKISDIKTKIQNIKNVEQSKATYEKYIIKLICGLFDRHVISNNVDISNEYKWSLGEKLQGISVKGLPSFYPNQNPISLSGTTMTSIQDIKNIEPIKYAKVYNHMINESVLEQIYHYIETLKYIDSYNGDPIFSIQPENKEKILLLINTSKNLIDVIKYDKEIRTIEDKITDYENDINLLEIEKLTLNKEKDEVKSQKLLVNIDNDSNLTLMKYLETLKKYHENFGNDEQDTNSERENLNSMMNIDMIEI